MLGMGIVFSFLVILVIAISLTSKVIKALGSGETVQPASSAACATVQNTVNDDAITAAITAAVNLHRKNK